VSYKLFKDLPRILYRMETYEEKLDEHIGKIQLFKENVIGEIYLITNTITNVQYVGQTRSHRLNHDKYRPFGYLKRFDSHISDAKTKCKGKLTYFHNALRKYGVENFTVQLVVRCKLSDLDMWEIHYIKQFCTLYPNGYNLTTGGSENYRPLRVVTPDLYEPIKTRSITKSEETKTKISNTLKAVHDSPQMRELYSKKALDQHIQARKELFNGVKIDKENINQYIRLRNSKHGQFYKIIVGKMRTSFSSRFHSIEELRQQAVEFLISL